MKNTIIASGIVIASLSSMACGDKTDQPPATAQNYNGQPGYPQQPGQYPQQPGAYPQQPGQPGAYPQQPGQPGAYPQPGQPTQPGAYPQPGQPTQPTQPGLPQIPGFPQQPAAGASGGSAQAIDPNLAQMAALPLTQLGNTEAPGMAKEGAMLAGNFQTGQTMETSFNMAPGKCYTAVAVAAGPGSQIDLSFMPITPIPGFQASFGSAQGKATATGSQAVLGSKAGCIKLALSPMPVQTKLVATMSKGAGMATIQLFSK